MNELVRIIFSFLIIISKFKNAQSDNLTRFKISWMPDVVIVGESHEIILSLLPPLSTTVNVTFVENRSDRIDWSPKAISVPPNSPYSNFTIKVDAKKAGKVVVTGISVPRNLIDDFNLFFEITIGYSSGLIIASVIVGWTYFLAWSISSYPQVVLNYKRKSVVGLSFDFLALNIVGHTSYMIFNVCLYYVDFFQEEYSQRFPHGQTPVLLNDVFVSAHNVFVYIIIILQCFVYKRGTQRISYITWLLQGSFLVIIIVVVILCSTEIIHWLDFLYTLSYIKLAVTFIKYIPQAVLNYRRKSTVGWSIGRVIFDLIGGVLSVLQMLINSFNYDDWHSFLGNPAKLCLGLFSVFFDFIFIFQHYCLYRNIRHPENGNSEITNVTIEAGKEE